MTKNPKIPSEPPTGLGAMENVVMDLPEKPAPKMPPSQPPKPKVNRFRLILTIVVGIFLSLLLLSPAVFLFIENQQLRKMTTQNLPASTPTPSPNILDQPQLGGTETEEECLEKGGVWQKWGLSALEYCQIPATDAGKLCTDGSQCNLGGCISQDGNLPGKCQIYKNTFGCFSYVRGNKLDYTICAD